MKERAMHGISEVLKNENTIRFPGRFADKADPLRFPEFLRNNERRRFSGFHRDEVSPDESSPFLSFKSRQRKAWRETRFGGLTGGNVHALAFGVITPAVIRAPQVVLDDLAKAHLGASMKAAIVV